MEMLEDDGRKTEEIIQRCINIERKIDSLVKMNRSVDEFHGNPDQHFGHITYAQHGDDLVALSLFHSIGISKPSYLDVGAHHPINISNTALLYARGCRGINVEPNPNLIQNFYQMRPDDINLNIGISDHGGDLDFYMIDEFSGRNSFDKNSVESFVKDHPEFTIREVRKIAVKTIGDVVDSYANGEFPDFFSLDVEGLDVIILRSLPVAKLGPKVICVEHTSAGSLDVYSEIKAIMAEKDYFSAFKTAGNAFFVRNEYKDVVL